jgi:hypothetical protein
MIKKFVKKGFVASLTESQLVALNAPIEQQVNDHCIREWEQMCQYFEKVI